MKQELFDKLAAYWALNYAGSSNVTVSALGNIKIKKSKIDTHDAAELCEDIDIWRIVGCADDASDVERDEVAMNYTNFFENFDGEYGLSLNCKKIIVSHEMTNFFKKSLSKLGLENDELSFTKDGQDLSVFDLVFVMAKVTRLFNKSDLYIKDIEVTNDKNVFSVVLKHP